MRHVLFPLIHTSRLHTLSALALVLGAAIWTSGCGPVGAFGVGAVSITTGSQERGFGGVVNDAEIHSKINFKFFDYHVDLFKRLNVTVYDGRVLLTGSVPNAEAREDAVALTRQVAGVREVLDEIRIGAPLSPDAYLLDSWIANQIRTSLLITANIQSGNYTVDVEEQIVYLMGLAQDAAEMERVIGIAQDTPDVIKVVSYIQIKPPSSAPQPRMRGEATMGRAPLPAGASGSPLPAPEPAPVTTSAAPLMPAPAPAPAPTSGGWLEGQVVDPEVSTLPIRPVATSTAGDLAVPPPELPAGAAPAPAFVAAHPVASRGSATGSGFIE